MKGDDTAERLLEFGVAVLKIRRGSKPGNPVSNHAFFLGGGGGPSPASAATRGLPRLGA